MSSVDEIRERIEELTRRHKKASDRRSRLTGKLEEKKAELSKLKQEIEASGLNPKDLKTEKARLEEELNKLMDTFENDLTQAEKALDEYES